MEKEELILKRDDKLSDDDGSRIELILYASGRMVLKGEKTVQDWLARKKTKRFQHGFKLSSSSYVDTTNREKQKKKRYYFEIMENREKEEGSFRVTLRADSRKSRGEWIRAISEIVSIARKSQRPPLVINLQRVLGVPNDNKDDPADCFVTMQLSCSDREIRWPCVKDSKNPVWQLPMEVYPVEPPKDVRLTIKLYDRNLMRSHDLLGMTQTKLDTLEMDSDVLLPFRLENNALESKKRAGEEDMICAVVLRRVDTTKCPKRKLLFLIRHGESEWNRAEKEGVMSVMHELKSVDHPLSELGITQATTLRERLQNARQRRRRHGKTNASVGVGVDGNIVEGMQMDIRHTLERVLTSKSSMMDDSTSSMMDDLTSTSSMVDENIETLLYRTAKRWKSKSQALKNICDEYDTAKEDKEKGGNWTKRLRDALGVTLLGINEAEEFGCFRFDHEEKEEEKEEEEEIDKHALKIETNLKDEIPEKKKKLISPKHKPPRSPSSPLNEPKRRDRTSSFVPRQMLRIFDKALIAGDMNLYQSIQSEMRDRSSKPLKDNSKPIQFRDFLEDELVFKMFEECTSIIMSPLCRAVQTGLLCLQDHPRLWSHGAHLLRWAREIKMSTTWLDCVGAELGSGIKRRSLEKLRGRLEAPAIEKLRHICFDDHSVRSTWWTLAFDSNKGAQRVDHIMNFLKYSKSRVITLVGHSALFRKIFASYSDDISVCTARRGHLLESLETKKICNGGLLATVMHFKPVAQYQVIEDAYLMLGSDLCSKKGSSKKKKKKKKDFDYESDED